MAWLAMSLGLLFILLPLPLWAQEIVLKGRVTDPQGNGLPEASVQLVGQTQVLAQATSGPDGLFQLRVGSAGEFVIKVDAAGFRQVTHPIAVRASGNPEIQISMGTLSSHIENITVTADVNETDVLSPDPAERVFVRQDLLDANPGRPGAPVSIPGYPIETASSGIKAPQYFAPGVAGDHGEPIAQYIAVGSYLVPNNLSANAHGNGYADPNIFIPEILESVQVDGGAFNVREGNHSVNLAATYGVRSHLDPFITLTGDYRDIDVVAGFSPTPDSFLAVAGSYGNGFLDRLEHRQQYKINGQRVFRAGEHRITLLGIGYYGSSYIPGLTPIFNTSVPGFPNVGDTIDPRQKDQTHTALVALNDVWEMTGRQQLQLSGFLRTYNLALYSDFGLGLLRQSEFRTVAGGSTNYVNKIAEALSLLVGLDYEREAPRRDNLDHYGPLVPPTPPDNNACIGGFFNSSTPYFYGPFKQCAKNNVTIGSVTPYIAAEGALTPFLRYYAGWRRDEIDFSNQDLLDSQNSFQKWVGVNSPKATITFIPRQSWLVPRVSLSFGESFFTNDPRIGQGATLGSPVSRAHSYQLVASKTLRNTDVRLTLGHVTTSSTLAKLDNDTGLQENEGPGVIRFMTVAVRRNFKYGSLLATFSKADARDLDTGERTPEAPRTIFDLLAAIRKLPLHLEARGEFEYVGKKPLGTGCFPINECVGVPVKEFRGAVIRPFLDGRVTAGVNFLIADGYTGQTTESFYPSEQSEVVGVRIPSYASISVTYRFGRAVAP